MEMHCDEEIEMCSGMEMERPFVETYFCFFSYLNSAYLVIRCKFRKKKAMSVCIFLENYPTQPKQRATYTP
jgi:hypothetical protein